MQKALVVLGALAVRERATSLFGRAQRTQMRRVEAGRQPTGIGGRPVSVFIPATGGRAGIV